MRPRHLLVDIMTRLVLTSSPYAPVMAHLQRMMSNDTYWAVDAHFPHYGDEFPIKGTGADSHTAWIWHHKRRILTPAKPGILTDDILRRATLATAKRDGLTNVFLRLSVLRLDTGAGIAFQETVYAQKRLQAAAFLEQPQSDVRDFPYVEQHAQFADLTPQQAARDIVFAAKLFDEMLTTTEAFRLRYFRLIREAKSVEEIRKIVADFDRETSADSLS